MKSLLILQTITLDLKKIPPNGPNGDKGMQVEAELHVPQEGDPDGTLNPLIGVQCKRRE